MPAAPAVASLIDENMPDGSAADTPLETSIGVRRTNVHSSGLKVSCLAMLDLLGATGKPGGPVAAALPARHPLLIAHCLLISTRRASALLVLAPVSTDSGGFISMFVSATPAAVSASWTAMARFFANSSFFAVSPVLSV